MSFVVVTFVAETFVFDRVPFVNDCQFCLCNIATYDVKITFVNFAIFMGTTHHGFFMLVYKSQIKCPFDGRGVMIVLFNKTLNVFYLLLYDAGHHIMMKVALHQIK